MIHGCVMAAIRLRLRVCCTRTAAPGLELELAVERTETLHMQPAIRDPDAPPSVG